MKAPIIRPNVDLFKKELMPLLDDILSSNMLTNVYKYTGKFEEKIRDYVVSNNTIAVSSGTSGLILTLEALGVRKKDIILPSFTFVATPASAYWTNNKIIFSEIDDTYTADPEDVRRKITANTGAIIAVHMYGNPCYIRELEEIAEEKEIPLIFDSAHALGSRYGSEKVGIFGTAEIFSLSPTKLITTVEGGCISTNDDDLAEKLKVLRNYGMKSDYTSESPGLNARLSEIHSAVGLTQVDKIDEFVVNRNKHVECYKKHLSNIPGISFQRIQEDSTSAHKDFSVHIDPNEFGMDRDELGKLLEKEGIGTKRYFFPPMHRLNAYRNENISLNVTDRISYGILSLPIYNYMENELIDNISGIIKRAHIQPR